MGKLSIKTNDKRPRQEMGSGTEGDFPLVYRLNFLEKWKTQRSGRAAGCGDIQAGERGGGVRGFPIKKKQQRVGLRLGGKTLEFGLKKKDIPLSNNPQERVAPHKIATAGSPRKS